MSRSTIYAGLEIGTSKICIVVGEVLPDGAIRILGVGQTPSCGVRKGEVIDMEKAQDCIVDALKLAEDRSDVAIDSVMLAVTGPHIRSLNNKARISLPEADNEVTEDDIETVQQNARDVALPENNLILHSTLREYVVDGVGGILDPKGRAGQTLEAHYHIVHCHRNRLHNTLRCVTEMPLEVDDVVFAPIAAAQVVLDDQARRDGALLIDIGGGTTDYALFAEGKLSQSGSIGLGGDHISADISAVFNLPHYAAERLKIDHGNIGPEPPTEADIITLNDQSILRGMTVSRTELNEVIFARVVEIFEVLRTHLEKDDSFNKVGAGIYLTGGSSLLRGVSHVATEVLGLRVNDVRTSPISGLSARFENPQYATPIGLIRYAQYIDSMRPQRGPFSRLRETVGGWLKSFHML